MIVVAAVTHTGEVKNVSGALHGVCVGCNRIVDIVMYSEHYHMVDQCSFQFST
jgi:hypothetical protein